MGTAATTVTIESGTIYGGMYALSAYDGSKTSNGRFVVNGGEIIGPCNVYNITITGGTFDGYVYAWVDGIITGGTFGGDADKYFSYFIPSGYLYVENSDGSYTVVKAAAGVYIPYLYTDGKYYNDYTAFETFEEAVAYYNSDLSDWAEETNHYAYLYLYEDCDIDCSLARKGCLWLNGYNYTGTVTSAVDWLEMNYVESTSSNFYEFDFYAEIDYKYDGATGSPLYKTSNEGILGGLKAISENTSCSDAELYIYGDFVENLVIDFEITFKFIPWEGRNNTGSILAADGYSLVENEGVYTITKIAE